MADRNDSSAYSPGETLEWGGEVWYAWSFRGVPWTSVAPKVWMEQGEQDLLTGVTSTYHFSVNSDLEKK